MIKVGIGAVVDFIADKARHRGIIHEVKDGVGYVPILGGGVYEVPLNNCVAVKSAEDVVELLRA